MTLRLQKIGVRRLSEPRTDNYPAGPPFTPVRSGTYGTASVADALPLLALHGRLRSRAILTVLAHISGLAELIPYSSYHVPGDVNC